MIVPHLAIHYMNSEKLNFIKYMHITKKKFIVLTNTEPHLVHGCLSETTKVSKIAEFHPIVAKPPIEK